MKPLLKKDKRYRHPAVVGLERTPLKFHGYTMNHNAEVWTCDDGFVHLFNPNNWELVRSSPIQGRLNMRDYGERFDV